MSNFVAKFKNSIANHQLLAGCHSVIVKLSIGKAHGENGLKYVGI